MLAPCTPFSFGTFHVYAGRNAYTVVNAEISNYFQELKADFEGTCYGIYFMEVADYYSRENLDGSELLNLLYASLRALTNKHLERELVRSIFEMKAMVLDGEYPYETAEDPSLQESTRYALAYVIQAPIRQLYTFTLKPEILKEFQQVQKRMMKRLIGREFKSMEVLRKMIEV
jgi:DNA repair protein RecO (recombination protein O)